MKESDNKENQHNNDLVYHEFQVNRKENPQRGSIYIRENNFKEDFDNFISIPLIKNELDRVTCTGIRRFSKDIFKKL